MQTFALICIYTLKQSHSDAGQRGKTLKHKTTSRLPLSAYIMWFWFRKSGCVHFLDVAPPYRQVQSLNSGVIHTLNRQQVAESEDTTVKGCKSVDRPVSWCCVFCP